MELLKDMIDMLYYIDAHSLLWIQNHVRQDWLTPIMQFITNLGNAGAIWIAFTVLMLIFKKTRKTGWMSFASLSTMLIINNLFLKNAVHRTRPYEVIEGLELITKVPSDYSFPSGHAACAMAGACIIYRYMPKWVGVPAMILAFAISASRLYVGVHYPSDVIGGMILGVIFANIGEWLVKLIYKKIK